ncbi:ornithine cyclodeaminase family protein [Heyndrickxia acidiproducens]|uniref:ornithine cyclodeaminase family protein n=1 Tax=Heyndrickxia acidiproducens TaxID=1121084 RepID=UPI00036744DB|nr:hypothetical protein [Heyndrickxia acidiproducens]
MLVLNETDILGAVTMNDMIAAVERAYAIYEDRAFEMPLRSHLQIQQNSALFMPCGTKKAAGAKIVTVFPENKIRPATQGIVVLIDEKNGSIKALLDGTVLTGLRTGALGGAASKYLAPDEAGTVGLAGTGYQGLYQLLAVCAVRDIRDIYLYNRSAAKIPSFIRNLTTHLAGKQIQMHAVENARELVRHSDIIITATSSATPVLPDEEDLYQGKLIIGIGSYLPHMQEFPDGLLKNSEQIFVDSLDAVKESGDLLVPLEKGWLKEEQIIPFSKVAAQKVKPKLTGTKPLVFKSTGMALFDLAAAETVFEKAVQLRLGINLKM